MLFTPNIKRKCGVHNKKFTPPLPNLENRVPINGLFTGISVEISEPANIIELYENGCFGKGSLSRGAPQIVMQRSNINESVNNESLILGLEEAFFLSFYLEILQIYNLENKLLTWLDMYNTAMTLNPEFTTSLAAYIYLKSKNWIIKSGMKFGGTFLIYKKGPRFNHASFVVFVSTPSNTIHLSNKNLKGLQRVAETSDKDVLFLEVTLPTNFELHSLLQLQELKVTETVVRRFNYTSFVQNQKPKTST